MCEKGNPMKTIQRFAIGTMTAAMLLGLAGCSGMSTQDKNTAIGAGAGAVGGAILTGGSTVGTVGGAVVGGVIGHEVKR
jgi:osmotically inducible lipoprotein OsmB